MRLSLAAVVLWSGCYASTDTIGRAVGGTMHALAAAAVSRGVYGDCYASCPIGTTCNRDTGFCDELPCRGACGANETCDALNHCVARGAPAALASDTAGDAPSSAPTHSKW